MRIEVTNTEIRDRLYPTRFNNQSWRNYTKAARVYFGFEGEHFLDNLFNRHNRPHKEIRKILGQTLDSLGITYKSVRWSQYAGCTCPCSPGFILANANLHNKDIYLMLRLEAEGHGQPTRITEGSNVRS